MYEIDDDIKRYLTPDTLAHTAEMLAMPQLVCRHRDCRRKQKCTWYFKPTGEPCCLANLDADQRHAFDDMARRVARAWWTSRSIIRYPMTSYFREERALEDAAMETIRPLVGHNSADKLAYRKLLRNRAKEPPPHRDGHEPRYR